MEIAKKHQDRLKKIKKNIEKGERAFKENNKRFHEFQKFVFKSALTPADVQALKSFGKPILECNITNAPISRLGGEFSKQEPSIAVSAKENEQVDGKLLEVIEGHIRQIMHDARKHNTQYNIYRDQLSGGFSDYKVWTEYLHEFSFDQIIRVGRVFDPTMCGYDPMAREVDKSDASYCFEFYPMHKDEFKYDYPDVDLKDLSLAREEGKFAWSYKRGADDIIVVAEYYEKIKKKVTIVSHVNPEGGRPLVKTKKEYEEYVAEWLSSNRTEQVPAVIDERKSDRIIVARYKVMETKVLEYKETPFRNLPRVFADGDSINIKNDDSNCNEQFTKPYIYHAKGIQRLTNFSAQVIANDFESMVMHKFKVAQESLPDEQQYLDAYDNVQLASTLVYKAFYEENPDKPVPPPQEIARIPLPPEVLATFNTSMNMLQNILGSYDAALGINDKDLSGKAIVEGATQSNAAAMPYVVNHMQALTQVAQIIVDIMPKYYVTTRTIPIIDREGKPSYAVLNDKDNPESISMKYDPAILNVNVEAGVNFSIAKDKALQQIIALMQVSPMFAQFINDVGLEILLDNVEFRNVDILKSKVAEWLEEKKKEAQNHPSPEQIQAKMEQDKMQLEGAKLQQKAQEAQNKNIIEGEKINVERERVANERMDIIQKGENAKVELLGDMVRAEAEESRAQADIEMKHDDMVHRQAKEFLELHKEPQPEKILKAQAHEKPRKPAKTVAKRKSKGAKKDGKANGKTKKKAAKK